MREVIVEVPREYVEEVLDQLLPAVPGGVREVARGGLVELRMRGDHVPPLAEIDRAVGRWPHRTEERAVPDDWRERRLADYEPDLIGGRLVVRPDWAPATRDRGILDVVLAEGSAFGAGTHPTTRACLELLLELTPEGSFADLGCGTGLLAIVAARLGWAPVHAVDVQPGSVEAALRNARNNDVVVEAQVLDLATQPAPTAGAVAANVPAWLHARVAASFVTSVPGTALVSGFATPEADGVLAAYASRGLRPVRQTDAHGWVVAVLEQSLSSLDG